MTRQDHGLVTVGLARPEPLADEVLANQVATLLAPTKLMKSFKVVRIDGRGSV